MAFGLVVRSRHPSRSKSKGDELVDEEVDDVDEDDELDRRADREEEVVDPTTAPRETGIIPEAWSNPCPVEPTKDEVTEEATHWTDVLRLFNFKS